MHKQTDTVNLTIQEYADIFSTTKKKHAEVIDWKRIERKLQNEMDWTQEGASHIAALARDYGSFVLRNATALAISLGIEDGDLGL
jgi:hypothetical protein